MDEGGAVAEAKPRKVKKKVDGAEAGGNAEIGGEPVVDAGAGEKKVPKKKRAEEGAGAVSAAAAMSSAAAATSAASATGVLDVFEDEAKRQEREAKEHRRAERKKRFARVRASEGGSV